MDKTSVKKIYNNYAHFYNFLFSKILDPARKIAIQKMNIHPNENIIEIGIGTGLSLKHYNSLHDISITGIDLSDKMLKKAQLEAIKYPKLKVTLNCIDGENTPYKDSTFDKVILMYVYSVTPNPEKLLKEAIRICKDNGSIYIINHFSNYEKNKLNFFEKSLSNFSNLIGFRSDFSYVNYIENNKLNIESVESANLFSLSKVIHFKKNNNLHLLNLN